MKNIVPLVLVFFLLIVSGCTNTEHKISISAEASLKGSLSKLATTYEAEHSDVTVSLNFGAAGKLAQNISKGISVDVFLSAGQKWMDKLAEQNIISADATSSFATNKLVLVANKNASFSIGSLEDLPTSGLEQISIGNPASVPAGHYAKQALEAIGIWDNVAKQFVYTKDVRQVLTHIESGDTDVGFVYASVLEQSDMVKKAIEIDESLYEPIILNAAVISSSEVKDQAKSFVEFLQSDQAQSILINYGFDSK